jgi:fucose permease
MTATGLGAAAIPSLLGVLARRFSLEVIPSAQLVLFMALSLLFLWFVKNEARPRVVLA